MIGVDGWNETLGAVSYATKEGEPELWESRRNNVAKTHYLGQLKAPHEAVFEFLTPNSGANRRNASECYQ